MLKEVEQVMAEEKSEAAEVSPMSMGSALTEPPGMLANWRFSGAGHKVLRDLACKLTTGMAVAASTHSLSKEAQSEIFAEWESGMLNAELTRTTNPLAVGTCWTFVRCRVERTERKRREAEEEKLAAEVEELSDEASAMRGQCRICDKLIDVFRSVVEKLA